MPTSVSGVRIREMQKKLPSRKFSGGKKWLLEVNEETLEKGPEFHCDEDSRTQIPEALHNKLWSSSAEAL